MDLCWSCKTAKYHDYKDSHGIRCPRCGQKKSDDPANKPKPAVKRKTRSRT